MKIYALPVFNNKWKKIWHGRCPKFSQCVVIETGIKGHNIVDVFLRNW